MNWQADSAERHIWVTAEGEQIPYRELKDSHLLNIERMLVGRGANDYSDRDDYFVHYQGLRDEIDRRGLEPLPDHPNSAPDRRAEHRTRNNPRKFFTGLSEEWA